MSLRPSSVLITGTNRGLGLELVKQLLQLPTPPKFVFATCRAPEKAKELNDVARENKSVVVLEMDVARSESISSCAKTVGKSVGEAGLNVLINNAGYKTKGGNSMNEETPETMMDMFQINSVGPLLVTRLFLPLLEKARNSSNLDGLSINKSAIVNITSIKGSVATTKHHNCYGYRASKAALNMISKLLSIELKGEDIFVIGLHPGWVKTDMGGEQADLEIDFSIESMIKLMETFHGEEKYGKYLNWDGRELPW